MILEHESQKEIEQADAEIKQIESKLYGRY